MSKLQAGSVDTTRYFTGPLYDRMTDDLHLAGMSQRTHDGYLRAVRQLADYCKAAPDEVTEDQLRRYFLYLKNEKKFAYGSLRVAFSGIKFFYTRNCKRDWSTLAQMKLQNVKSLPEVLTISQVHKIIDAATTLRMAVYFWTGILSACGCRKGLTCRPATSTLNAAWCMCTGAREPRIATCLWRVQH